MYNINIIKAINKALFSGNIVSIVPGLLSTSLLIQLKSSLYTLLLNKAFSSYIILSLGASISTSSINFISISLLFGLI